MKIVIFVAIIIAIVAAVRFLWPAQAPMPFQGPTASPYVKGPTELPPQ